MISEISIVIPSKNSPGIADSIESIRLSSYTPYEVVIVDASDPPLKLTGEASDKFQVHLISRRSTQLQAQEIGTRAATRERVLFLDSDQRLSPDLLLELSSRQEAAVMMREIAPGSGLIPRLMTRNADYLVRLSQIHPSVAGLAIPRFFSRSDLVRAFDEIGPGLFSTELWRDAHSDSVLFAAWATSNHRDISTSVGVAKNPIYHIPPTLAALYRKTFAYGKNRAEFLRGFSSRGSPELEQIPEIIAKANLHRVYFDRAIGVNMAGLILDFLKFPPYLAGSVLPRRDST